MHHGHGRVGRARPGVTADVSGDHPQQGPTVRRREEHDVGRSDVLVAGGDHLVRLRQVHPQLDAVEQPAAGHQLLRWLLDVEDAPARGHPLGVAVGDEPSSADRILVLEGAVDHVGHRLEAPMRVPRGALGLARRVLHLPHLVHVDERVEVAAIDAGEGPVHREPLTLVSRRARSSPPAPDGAPTPPRRPVPPSEEHSHRPPSLPAWPNLLSSCPPGPLTPHPRRDQSYHSTVVAHATFRPDGGHSSSPPGRVETHR